MRLIVLFTEVKQYQISFDVYGLMLYYGKKIDEAKASLLFKTTLSEYWYKINNGYSAEGLTSDDEEVAILFNEIPNVINFINMDILPSLILEVDGIMQKYGGTLSFDALFRNEPGFTKDIFLDDDYQEDNADIYSKGQIIRFFEYLRDFLQFTLDNHIRYRVFMD